MPKQEALEGIERPERSEGKALGRMDARLETREIRSKIGFIAGDDLYRKLASKESIQGYQDLAMGREKHKLTPEQLQGFYKYLEKDHRSAKESYQRIDTLLRNAVTQRVASQGDYHFLMNALIFNQQEHLGSATAGKAEKLVHEKIEHMKKDKDAYVKFKNHKLVGDSGMLVVDKATQIEVPNEEKFMKLSVPDRRNLLKRLEEALPKAQAYAERVGTAEGDKATTQYDQLLKGAMDRGILGQRTYKKFIESFKKLSKEDKQEWIAGFPAEMARYERLWKDIRGTLEGESLSKMENFRDSMGYTELFQTFGEVKHNESERLTNRYAGKLREARDTRKIIGKHTYDSFLNGPEGIRNVPLKTQRAYAQQFESQMARYQVLWDKIRTGLKPTDRKTMENVRDDYGYSQLQSEYLHLKAHPGQNRLGAQDALGRIRDDRKRAGIMEAAEILEGQGKEQKQGFLSRVRSLFSKQTTDSAKTSGFQEKLIKARKVQQETNEKKAETSGGQASDNVIDFQAALKAKKQAQTPKVEGAGTPEKEKATDTTLKSMKDEGVELKKRVGFTQAKIENLDGQTQRVTRVEINRKNQSGGEGGLKTFLQENRKDQFRGKDQGGTDDVTLSVRTKEGQVLDLNVQEIKAMRDHLNQVDLDKAA